ncbi:creatininase family protein [uncultured Albimonas sp.]|uniref:creatininase family protein n=1 Tax=uncultured Albimonas sp. TaxID=1331701 RepID=UPI0030ED8197|tara:strand:+ start:1002 stop:1817 length:816 start_codon:yes stop_codon:yes gene_type:complete
MTRRLHWLDYSTTEYADIDPAKTIAILPTAAIEQHGPHLPVGVDTEINLGMLREVCARVPEDLDIRILPVQAVGKSNEHLHAPGTLTLSAETALAAWVEIGLSVARAGVRKLIIVNSHGGNLDLISIATRELRVRAGMLAVRCQWGAFGHPEGMLSEREKTYGIHGGDAETSLMLHFRPELVRMERAKDFASSAEGMGDFRWLRPTGSVAYGWIAKDLNPDGTVGDASAATAERGAAIAAHQAKGFIELLREVESVDLATFAAFSDPPPGA